MKQFIFSLNMTSRMDPRGDLKNHIQIASDLYTQVIDDVKQRAKELEYAPYKVGDRIGQMVFLNYPTVILEEVEELSETERGEKGFGSTGN
jgi:dUTPase